MKTFKDLEFKTHPSSPYGFDTHAEMHFENGYGVSVITGKSAYTNSANPYEIAILYGDEITYNTDITNEVLGYQDEDDVTNVMKQVQELKAS